MHVHEFKKMLSGVFFNYLPLRPFTRCVAPPTPIRPLLQKLRPPPGTPLIWIKNRKKDGFTWLRYRVINYNCKKRTLYCRATIGLREVRNQFPISIIVTVLPCIILVNPMDDPLCLVKIGLDMEKKQKSLILVIFDEYLA